jgi:hypothetical protein
MLFVIAILFNLMVTAWVYRDATKRGEGTARALVSATAVCLLMIIFLPVYLLTRPPLPRATGRPTLCSTCGKYAEAISGSAFCPLCGANRGVVLA